MGKKILKVSSIVVACVLAFVGAVVGVLAIMGKFNEKIVYPDRLEFLNAEQTVIMTGKENGTSGKEYKYFTLAGYSNGEDAVNRKVCYLTIEKGAELIELLDSRFKPIVIDNNRYRVECNEKIYYRLRSAVNNFTATDGEVVIRARDEKNMVVSSNKLRLWLDRPVEEIYLDYDVDNTYSNKTQSITLGINIRQDLKYTSKPIVALDPIASRDGKIVELYYDDPNDRTDFILLDSTKTSDKIDGYEFLKIDSNNQLYFDSAIAGIYKFKIAVFDTYKSRDEYSLDPNDTANSVRINHMVTTSLEISVVNSNVESVGMLSNGVALNLYADNNYITLNANKEGVNNNNLGLFMKRDGRDSELRFNEVDFTLDESNYPSNWSNAGVTFESTTGKRIVFNQGTDYNTIRFASGFDLIDSTLDYSYTSTYDDSTNTIEIREQNTSTRFIINLGQIKIANKTVISSITFTDGLGVKHELICSNGLAFYERILDDAGLDTHCIKLLKTGSFLDFYIYNSVDATYTRAT